MRSVLSGLWGLSSVSTRSNDAYIRSICDIFFLFPGKVGSTLGNENDRCRASNMRTSVNATPISKIGKDAFTVEKARYENHNSDWT